MTCAQNCNTQDAQFLFVTGAGDAYALTLFSESETFITFDDDETNINTKRDSEGNARRAGNNFVKRPFSVEVPCSPEALELDRAWRANPISMCGDGELITGCCEDSFYRSLTLEGVKAPDIGANIDYYTFNFMGVIL